MTEQIPLPRAVDTGAPLLEPHDVFNDDGCYARTDMVCATADPLPYIPGMLARAVAEYQRLSGWPLPATPRRFNPFFRQLDPGADIEAQAADRAAWIDQLRRRWRLVTAEHGTTGLSWTVKPDDIGWPKLAGDPVTDRTG